jgi:hypothetical protein
LLIARVTLDVGGRRIVRRAAVCIAALVLAATSAAEPRDPTRLPAGWIVERNELVWISASPLRMGGARYEFRSGGQVLGYPVQHGNTLRLPIRGSWQLDELSVWAAGRRIDAAAPLLRITGQMPAVEPEIAGAAADPATRGPYRAHRLQYRLPGLALEGYAAPIEVVAEVTTPTGVDAPMPLVLFLHGRHSTCYRGGPKGEASGDWPCPAGWRPVPSHTGYRYITDVLASQGYLTVSISANGINGQDGLFIDGGASARSQLIRHHLALWSEWTSAGGDPWGGRFLGRVNLDEVVLVGHSRGGEGVERAAIDTDVDDPWQIQGLVLIGPTAFGRQVAPGIHTTVILPFCDGDVTTLEGQQYVDIGRDLTTDRALRSSVTAMGTNHNFYNTEWTPGLSRSPAWDDWFDPEDRQCGANHGARLTPTEQQAVGLAYAAALVDLAVADDVWSLPLLDGTLVKPRSIGRANAHVHAIGGDKRLVYAAGTGIDVTARALTATECRGYFLAGPFDLRSGCTPSLRFEVLPHWIPMSFAETAPSPRALRVAWQQPGGAVRIPVNRNLSGASALDFRIAGQPDAPPVELTVRVRDAFGGTADLAVRPVALRSFGGPNPLGKVEARQLRASLRGAAIDLRHVSSIELVPRTTRDRFFLLDVSTWQDSLAPSDALHLPRVSIGDVVVAEGDAGEVTVDVPITIEGAVTRRATLWVQLTDPANFTEPFKGFPLVLEPGTTSATVPVTYRADDVFNPFEQRTQVTLLARKTAVTADYDATVLVEEDDPAPILAVDADRVTAAEGSELEWIFHLSAPMASSAFWSIQMLPPNGRFIELTSDDVPPSFLESYGIVPPDPAVPLSDLGIFFGLEFAPGATEARLTIPIARDATAEPLEGVVLRLESSGDPVVPRTIELTGVVPAH